MTIKQQAMSAVLAMILTVPAWRPAEAQVVGSAFEGTNVLGTNYFLGKTGIGTNQPGQMLHVVGDSRLQGGVTVDGAFQIPKQGDLSMGSFTNGVSDNGIVASNLSLRGAWISYDGSAQGVYVASDGKVGVGTATPSVDFHVNGTGQVTHLTVDAGITLGGEVRTNWSYAVTEAGYLAVSNGSAWASNTAAYASNGIGGDVVVLTNGQDLAAAITANDRTNVTFLLPYGTITIDSSKTVKDGVALVGRGMDRSIVVGGGKVLFSYSDSKVVTNHVRGLTWNAAAYPFFPNGTYATGRVNAVFFEDVRTTCPYLGSRGAITSRPNTYYVFRGCSIDNTSGLLGTHTWCTNSFTLIDTTVAGSNYVHAAFRSRPAMWTPAPVMTNYLRVSELQVDSGVKMQAAATNPATYSGGVQLWAQSSSGTNELFVMDGAGNITQLSTHEQLKHVAHSWNIFTGQGRLIDMDALAEAVVEMTGKTGIVRKITVPRVDWDALEQEKVRAREAEILEWLGQAGDEAGMGPEPYMPQPKPDWLIEWEKANPVP